MKRLEEGKDFYFDKGFMVLTSGYLLERGHCCGNGCRNCPYKNIKPVNKEKRDECKKPGS